MPSSPYVPADNRLLAALPRENHDRLLATSEEVQLILADVIYRAGDEVPYVYFPTGGFISLLMPEDQGPALEVGLIGNEGMLGITLTLEVDIAPFHALVQGSGSALRISAVSFSNELERSPALRRHLKRYLYVTMVQLAQTVTCTQFHLLEARLARWLLRTQDRACSNTVRVTHACLAHMLGVRRVGITQAAGTLQRQKVISYHRGEITILNRAALEAASCGCYRADEGTYERILNCRPDGAERVLSSN